LHQNNCQGLFDVVAGDLHEHFRGKVDVLIFNPPYVPTDADEYKRAIQLRDISAAWAGGMDGREVLDRLLPDLSLLVRPHGLVYIVVLQANRPDVILKAAKEQGFDAKIVLSRTAEMEKLSIVRLILGE